MYARYPSASSGASMSSGFIHFMLLFVSLYLAISRAPFCIPSMIAFKLFTIVSRRVLKELPDMSSECSSWNALNLSLNSGTKPVALSVLVNSSNAVSADSCAGSVYFFLDTTLQSFTASSTASWMFFTSGYTSLKTVLYPAKSSMTFSTWMLFMIASSFSVTSARKSSKRGVDPSNPPPCIRPWSFCMQ